MSQRRTLAFSAAGALMLLAACGTDSGSNDDDPIVLTHVDMYEASRPQGEAIEWLLSEYESQHPNVTIEKSVVPGDNLPQTLISQTQTGDLPDIALVDNPTLPAVAAAGGLRPLNSLLDEWGLSDAFTDGAIEATTDEDGNINGVFLGVNTLSIMYNVEMFEEAGIAEAPVTWDEFAEVARDLTDDGVHGFAFGAQSGGCAPWHFNAWQWSAGGSDIPLDDPDNVRALEFLVSLVDEGSASRDVVNQCQDEGMQAFVQGQVAMILNGPWSHSTLDTADFEWDAFSIPVPEAGDDLVPPLGGEVWVLPETGDERYEQAANDFIEWSQSEEIATEFAERLGYASAQPELWPAFVENDPRMETMVDSLEFARGRTVEVGSQYPEWMAALDQAIQESLLGQREPQDALEEAQQVFGG